jgi:hypothetical protein
MQRSPTRRLLTMLGLLDDLSGALGEHIIILGEEMI